jgi:CDP-paratose 2-epimerase
MKKMKHVLITGSAGLIGSQSVEFFIEKGYNIIGVDNDMRSYFFGEDASTKKSMESLCDKYKNYSHYNVDIRNYGELENIFKKYDIEIVIHTAAQPSHDWASKEPITDFTINALGTINLLELTRLYHPKASFIFTSTNKVYGDTPNKLPYIEERETRWECVDKMGNLISIDENMSIDNTKHSIFGASKVSADIMCQEYGKYFGMNVGVFRGGCLTGPNHAGTELHGFLSYLVKCIINNKPYTIFGYKGKQVRDNIHSWDLVNMFWHFHQNPKQGEVYNAGGGRENAISILEAIKTINEIAETNWDNYNISEDNRIGDHIWYISNINKFKKDYPTWDIKYNIRNTIEQMVNYEYKKLDKNIFYQS